MKLYRNIATLFLGSGAAKTIGLVVMPILTRVYSPDAFGVVGVFAACATLVASYLALMYMVAIPLPQDDAIAANHVSLCVCLVVFNCVILFLIGGWVSNISDLAPALAIVLQYYPLIIATAAAISVFEILSFWTTRKGSFRPLVIAQISQMIFGSFVKVAGGVSTAGSFIYLLAGHVIQLSLGALVLAVTYSSELLSHRRKITFRKQWNLAYTYRSFPQFRLPTQVAVAIATHSPIIFFSAQYGIGFSGQVSLAFMALTMPASMVAVSVSKAYYAEIASIARTGTVDTIRHIATGVCFKLFLGGLAISIFLFLLAPFLFQLVFGQQWSEAGRLARYLSVYLPFQFAYVSIGPTFVVFNQERKQLTNQLVRLGLVGLAFLAAILCSLEAHTAVIVYSGLLSLSYVFGLVQVSKVLRSM